MVWLIIIANVVDLFVIYQLFVVLCHLYYNQSLVVA